MIATLLGASVGVPYVASQSNFGSGDGGQVKPSNAASSVNQPITAPALGPAISSPFSSSVPSAATVISAAPVVSPSHPTIEQVFRFDVTKEWVYQHWARKTTAPTDVGLLSVRVQLVTGTRPESLAGALTYFFNEQNQAEHISLRGRVGDPAPLVQHVTRYFQLQPVSASVGEKAYQLGNDGRVQSELRVRPEGVITSASPQGSYVVELELARPGSQRYLPPRPIGLQVPPGPPSAPPAPGAMQKAGQSVQSAVGNYFDGARYATPQEEGQVLWKRWPN
jgi:hypothetical protein